MASGTGFVYAQSMETETKTETETRIVYGHSLELNMVIVDKNKRRYRVWRLRPGTSFETIKGTVRDDKGQLRPFTFKCETPFRVEVP